MAMPWWRRRERWRRPSEPSDRTALTAWEQDRFEEIVAAFDDSPGREPASVWSVLRRWLVPALGAVALGVWIFAGWWPLMAAFWALACVELAAFGVVAIRRGR